MDRKEFVLFISVPHKFFKPQPVHRCNQLVLTLTLSKKVKNTFDYLYKDENTGIEFISESQFKKRYKSDIRPNLQDIQRKLPIDIHAYQKITEILPSYLENVPEHIQKQKDIYVIPPRGRAWKERNSYTSTSYFHLDDYWVLVKIPSKKR